MDVGQVTVVRGLIRIGGFILEEPYGAEGAVAIYQCSDMGVANEGRDFDAAELEALIAKFYAERF